MILADTSVWIEYLRRPGHALAGYLARSTILIHPCIVGELALGSIKSRDAVLRELAAIPTAIVAMYDEVLRFITRHGLSGQGIGYVDAHLLASARLTPGVLLWTSDKRLHVLAQRLNVAFEPPSMS